MTALAILGARLAKRRSEAKLDATQLATRANVEPPALARFEAGEGGLGVSSLRRIAEVLGIHVATLVDVNAAEEIAPTSPDALLLASGGGFLTPADVKALQEPLRRAQAFCDLGLLLQRPVLADQFRAEAVAKDKPWRSGYALARSARKALTEIPLNAPLKDAQGVIEERFGIFVARVSFRNRRVIAASSRAGRARLIAIDQSLDEEAPLRVALAHELAHHLADFSNSGAVVDEGEVPFLLAKSPAEQRASAFAAMFLATEESVRRLIGPRPSEGSERLDVDRAVEAGIVIRRELGLGGEATAWHLWHLGYLQSEIDAERIAGRLRAETPRGLEVARPTDGVVRRATECLDKELISVGRARELMGLSPYDDVA